MANQLDCSLRLIRSFASHNRLLLSSNPGNEIPASRNKPFCTSFSQSFLTSKRFITAKYRGLGTRQELTSLLDSEECALLTGCSCSEFSEHFFFSFFSFREVVEMRERCAYVRHLNMPITISLGRGLSEYPTSRYFLDINIPYLVNSNCKNLQFSHTISRDYC